MYIDKGQCKRLDAFQAKGIRKILGWQSTYIDRRNTNKRLRKAAGVLLHRENPQGKVRVEPISKEIRSQQIKYMGHLLRETKDEVTKRVTFVGEHTPNLDWKMRAGRPRGQWITHILRKIWNKFRKTFVPQEEQISKRRFNHRHNGILAWIDYAALWREI